MFSVLPNIQRLAAASAAVFSLASADLPLRAQSLPSPKDQEVLTPSAKLAPVVLPELKDLVTYSAFLGRQYSLALGRAERLDMDRYGLLMNQLNHLIELGFGDQMAAVTKQLRFLVPSPRSEQFMIKNERTFYKMQNKDVAVSPQRLDAYLKTATAMLVDLSDGELEKIVARSNYKTDQQAEPRELVANAIAAHLVLTNYFCVASKVYLGEKFQLENHADWREMLAAEKVLAQRGRIQAVTLDRTYLALKDWVQVHKIELDRPIFQFIVQTHNQVQFMAKQSDVEAVATQAKLMPSLPSLTDNLETLKRRFGLGVAADLDIFNRKILSQPNPDFNIPATDTFMASAMLYQVRLYGMLVQDPSQLAQMKRVAETAAWNQ